MSDETNVAVQDNTEAVTTEENTSQETTTLADVVTADGVSTPESTEIETVIPVEYTDFTVEEGIKLDEDFLGQFKEVAKENNLTQDAAQKMIDLAVGHSKTYAEAHEKATQEEWTNVRQGWLKELKADKEFGGDKYDETIIRGQRMVKQFGDDGLTKFLNETGYGDHGSLIRMLARIDKIVGEDKAVDGKPVPASTRSNADVLFGEKKKK